jgi:hypothetical protein
MAVAAGDALVVTGCTDADGNGQTPLSPESQVTAGVCWVHPAVSMRTDRRTPMNRIFLIEDIPFRFVHGEKIGFGNL